MKTLKAAVAELNSLEDAASVLAGFNNALKPGAFRCTSCPAAQYLQALTGREVWVSPDGDVSFARNGQFAIGEEAAKLKPWTTELIRQFDVSRYDAVQS